jgi:putative tryptophan/tyrosine transport system substrate-binding protein
VDRGTQSKNRRAVRSRRTYTPICGRISKLAPDIILASGNATVTPSLQATRTVPVVFAVVADPVGSGYAQTLSRPGGNATGFMQFEYGLTGKWLELLHQIAPQVRRVAVFRDLIGGVAQFAVIQSIAPSVGIESKPLRHARRG